MTIEDEYYKAGGEGPDLDTVNEVNMTRSVFADDKTAFTSAIKEASFNYVTLIYLKGYSLRITIDPVIARKEYESRDKIYQTSFETRYTNKLQRMAKEVKKMDLQPFKQFI